ncbi:MAG: OmpA family protein [Desulfovibrionaceae bacterium]|nr:OmpA family protein [Desulfovibrionaceae bacterium]
MKSLRTLLLSAVLVMGLTPVAHAAESIVRSVDSFDFLVDYSGSMMMKSPAVKAPKIDVAKQALTKVNNAIPDLGYMASLHTFAPASTLLPNAAWNQGAMNQSLASLRDNLAVFGRLTPMGNGLSTLAPEYAAMARPTAVIIASDGLSNRGVDPVAEAAAIYQSQPGLCFHIISVAEAGSEGQATLDKIAALNNCTVMVNAVDLLNSQQAVDQFVADVFYDTVEEEAIILHGVNFAFDSYALDSKAIGILDEVASILKTRSGVNVTLEGWTDSIGTDAYNKGLSQRRADAVKKYLVKQGVPAQTITTKGMGKSFKYDNATEEGRYLNRRVELIFN